MFYNLSSLFYRTATFSLTMPTKRRFYNSEINRLIHGYEEFRADYFNNPHNLDVYKELVKHGQKPKTLVIACSDSRVEPSIVFKSKPGQLFVVRNVANLVPPYDNDPKHHGTSAALEFAVQRLEVQNIIVLGHSNCGGIRALLKSQKSKDTREPDFINSWMSIAKDAKEKALSECRHQSLEKQEKVCEEYSLAISYKNLLTFPWIQEKVSKGSLQLHAWLFNLNNGLIQRLNPQLDKFEDLVEEKNNKKSTKRFNT